MKPQRAVNGAFVNQACNKLLKGVIFLDRKRVYLASPHMSEEGYEKQFIEEAFSTNWIAPLGPNVSKFEEELCTFTGAGYAAALSSGTAATHLALKALGVGKGDIVFCSSFTFSATANPIIYQNAVPVFIDSDLETWNMNPNALEAAFKEYPQVKAVLIAHLYGLSADMDKITALCNKYGVPVVEDAAESLGATYKGRQTGTIGFIGTYSFNGNKIITTSGGGMLVSDNGNIIEKTIFWATQSKEKGLCYQHSELGYNYRMSNVLAGIGRGQLRVLPERIKKKREIFDFYKNELIGLEGLSMMPVNEWLEPNYWLSCIYLSGKVRPQKIMEALEKENIESRFTWKPMHLQPFYKGYEFFGDGTSDKIFENGLCLPSDTKMTPDELQLVADTIKKLW